QHPEENRRAPALGSMRAGLAFVFGTPLLLSALTLDMFSVLFGGATAVLPMFSDQLLHAGPMGLGLLRSAFSLGAVLMSIRLILRPMRTIRGSVLLAVVAGFGVTTVAFGFSRSLPLAMGMLFLCGAFDSVSMVIRSTILQLCTPDEMRGRVSSVNSIFIGSSNEIGAFESGVAARLLGLAPSIIFGGAMTLLIVGGTTTFSRALRKSVFKTG
ncbi:MAG: MFS transporter, partial [Bdellovibrionota bacterium]